MRSARLLAVLVAALAGAGLLVARDRGGELGVSPGATGTATVTHVTDGDTVRLGRLGRVRLIGIDTPEVYGRRECFGERASSFTKRLLPRGTRVRFLIGAEPRDRYGRALAYLWLPGGRMVNGALVAGGYAQPLTIPPNDRFAPAFARLARRARAARLGLWNLPGCADPALGVDGRR